MIIHIEIFQTKMQLGQVANHEDANHEDANHEDATNTKL